MSSLRVLSVAAMLLAAACAEGTAITGGSGGNGAGPSNGGNDPDGGGTTDGGNPNVGAGNPDGGAPTDGGGPSAGGGGSGPGCGNDVIDTGEDCDGDALGGATCASIGQGFDAGTLRCASDCSFDVSECEAPVTCGNSAIDTGEDCDGTLLNGGTCLTEGFDGGTISCGAGCTYNVAACTDCGNNLREGTEVCDGTALNNQTCQTQGFSGGTLACNAACTAYNTAGCTCTTTNLFVINGGFDSGPNGGQWTEASSSFGTPVCDVATCGTGGGTGPQAGGYWAWFGGTVIAAETATVTRSVVLNPGTATLRFQFDIPSCEDPLTSIDTFAVTVDGLTVFSTNNLDANCGVIGYELKTIDLTPYANGASHTIQFRGVTDDFDIATNFFVDSVEVVACQ